MSNWKNYQQWTRIWSKPFIGVDLSAIGWNESQASEIQSKFPAAFQAMRELEQGSIANPDEQRQVGHYWLRAPELAPAGVGDEIRDTLQQILDFADAVHTGRIQGKGGKFTDLLVIGIGGSALGPQFVAQALGSPAQNKLRPHFWDNTDPDGIATSLQELNPHLNTTLVVVISKSGGTPETRNGMLEAIHAFQKAGIPFAKQAVAVTGQDSKLDQVAQKDGWLLRLPMWDWVGGRTSETGPVGLLPAALQGVDIKSFLSGAADMDRLTRSNSWHDNPAAWLASAWYWLGNGKGERDMVILPYKDRLQLFSRYLQQLVMESLGKELDLQGRTVHQGIAVYGNKGSTDQHAYVQQLLDGLSNFFVTFVEVLQDGFSQNVEVEPGITSGDYLHGFLLGTRQALREKERPSLTLTLKDVSPASVGALIALFERAVGLYASLVGINAYHQPGVERGKKAAARTLQIQQQTVDFLKQHSGQKFSAEQIATTLDVSSQTELVFKILVRLSANAHSHVETEGDIHAGSSFFWNS
jgi:glucose-6-phosphate isomerase